MQSSKNANRVIIPHNWVRSMPNAGRVDRTSEKTFGYQYHARRLLPKTKGEDSPARPGGRGGGKKTLQYGTRLMFFSTN